MAAEGCGNGAAAAHAPVDVARGRNLQTARAALLAKIETNMIATMWTQASTALIWAALPACRMRVLVVRDVGGDSEDPQNAATHRPGCVRNASGGTSLQALLVVSMMCVPYVWDHVGLGVNR